jgi:hypothetical protein
MKKLNTSVAFQKFLKENGIVVPGCGRQKVVLKEVELLFLMVLVVVLKMQMSLQKEIQTVF